MEQDNLPAWTGKPGRYEVWFLTMSDGREGYWIRATLLAPSQGPGEARLWFARFDREDPSAVFGVNRAFPLEQLKMVGTLAQGKDTYALVRADKTLYRVKKGNYMGQNFGLITDVTDNEIKLKEIVQDSAGDWAERQSVLPLLEEAGKGDKK